MRVLLTGGHGLVGRNIREHPQAERHEILAPSRANLDLLEGAAVEAYLGETKPDLVIHAAGRVGGIFANIRDPVGFLVENTEIGRNVILGARSAGVKQLLNLASSCVYPRNAPNPLREESILQGELEPTNEGYAIAKIFALRLCQYIRKQEPEYDYKTLVPCNLFGRYDHFSSDRAHLVSSVIHRLHEAKEAGQRSVSIWGDGLARREFMFAGDFSDAVWKAAAEFPTIPELMNIGVGRDHTINEYYEQVAAVVGFRPEFVHDLSKPVGMRQKLVDTSRQEAWGWTPRTSLADGIRATYDFYLAERRNLL